MQIAVPFLGVVLLLLILGLCVAAIVGVIALSWEQQRRRRDL